MKSTRRQTADLGSNRFGRFLRLFGAAAAIIAAGLLYAAFIRLSGLAIPCPFRLLTGLKCPGCGVSRMCLALLRLDFRSAFGYNPAIFLMLPLGAAVFADMSFRYVLSGERRADRFSNISMTFMAAALVVFGIMRNIFGF